MQHRYWIGGGFILFGIYFFLEQMGIVVPLDFTLLIGLAFVAGYFVRKSDRAMDAFPLLAVSTIPLSIFASNNIDQLLPILNLPHHNSPFLFFLGLFIMGAWAIETGMSGYSRRYRWSLWLGGLFTLMGGYAFIAKLLNISPAFLGSLIFPGILIAIGVMIITKNLSEKK